MKLRFTEDILGHAVEESYYELSVLGGEMREAYEGTPDSLKDSAGRSRELAADILEDVTSPFVPVTLKDEAIIWIEKRPSPSRKLFRPARRDNATSALRACISFLSKIKSPDEATILFREQLERDVEMFDSVFFPGMTGR
ncbi:hypothetical protein [Rhodopseudomonas pseudopalustris]|uniref:hypothetical protein n=1 Tax=Rhodopseudomonas pseudopalustris TaxID=1513892 RepID=UPI000B86B25F|nr:hypothetical protein [Rhodopseudomonas pseudopalustris]